MSRRELRPSGGPSPATPVDAVTGSSLFEERVRAGQGVVLVEFWAAWCAPCQVLAPVVREVCELFGDLTVIRVDTDSDHRTTELAGVVTIPTLQLYRDGRLLTQLQGARPKQNLLREISAHLPRGTPDNPRDQGS